MIAASAALSLAIVTGAAAYIATDEAQPSTRHQQAADQLDSPAYEANVGESIAASEDGGYIPFDDPNERHAIEVAAALLDNEQQAREATAATAQSEMEERLRAEEAARVAAETAAAEAAAAYAAQQAAAEAARVAASRAASAATPVAPPAPAPTRTAAAESTVTQALTGAGSIQQAAAAAGWPAGLLAKVERVVLCESSGRTTAVSPAGYVGLMQVAPWLHGPVPADAVGQLAQAYGVYLRQGWCAWPVCGR